MSVDDICQGIRISKKTFYKYFKDKDMLVKNVSNNMLQDWHLAIADSMGNKDVVAEACDIADTIFRFNTVLSVSFFRDLEMRYPQEYAAFLLAKQAIIEEVIAVNIRRGKAQNLYRQNLDEALIAKLCFDMITLSYCKEDTLPQIKECIIALLASKVHPCF